MILNSALFLLGLIFLVKGADIMIDGSSSIAKRYGISTFVIGLTIIAFGTSMPELIVTLIAGIEKSSGIALGNIIGSNISNTLLILGTSALISPLIVRKNTLYKEIPFLLLSILVVGVLANDSLLNNNISNRLSRIDGLILLIFFIIFVYYTFTISKLEENIFQKTVDKINFDKKFNKFTSIVMIIVGLTGLVLGGYWVVNSALFFAHFFGLSEKFIGLTVVAIGTSLPELSASAVAAYKKKAEIAVGNIIGSNIFNILLILGLSASITGISYNSALNFDLLFLFTITVLLLFLIYFGKKNILDKKEGAILLFIYLFYLIFLTYRL